MTRQEQERMLAALMASSASRPRFASVDFAGTPGLQALGAERDDIDRRRRSLFEPPVAKSRQELFPTLATALVGAFQRNEEAADRAALLDQLTTPEITEADYEAYSSPYLAQTREAEQEAMLAPTDQGLGIDAQDFYAPASLEMTAPPQRASIDPNTGATTFSLPTYSTRDDFSPEEISVPSNALGLDPAQLGTFQSQAGTADQYIDTPLGDDPRMMSALIGDPQTVGQEREQIAGDFALDQSSPRALSNRIGSVETKTEAGRNLQQQMMTSAQVRDAAAAREAALLADERAEARAVADRLAKSKFIEAGIRASGGADSALVAQHKYLNGLRQKLAALRASNAPAAEIDKAEQEVRDMKVIIRATQYKDVGPSFVGLDPFTGEYTKITKGLNPEEELDHQAAKSQVQKIGTLHGESIHQQYQSAKNAIVNKEKIDTLFRALSKEGTKTGIGAEFIKDIKRLMVRISEDEGLQQEVANMESLESLMGSEVFPLIKLLGIGARGLDTPAERKFLQKVLTGNIGLNKSTLLRMAKIRMREADRAIEEWQSGINNKSRDIWYAATQEPRERLHNPLSIENRLVSVQGMSAEEIEAYVHEYLPPEIIKAATERLKELQ